MHHPIEEKTEVANKSKSTLLHWVTSIILMAPVFIFYATHYLSPLIYPENIPTGFMSYDMAYYMANAREYVDGKFHLFYSTPFTHYYHNPHIYFQPHILLLGIILKITGLAPGIIFTIFGLLSGIVCIRMVVLIFEQLLGLDDFYKKLGLILFCWGGGILALSGIAVELLKGSSLKVALINAFQFDPFNGWWFLNLGRNLIFPTEAYYHAIFLGTVYLLLKKRYTLGLIFTLILSLSHPFTGLELILIVLTWGLFEVFFLKTSTIPKKFVLGALTLLVIHLSYYILFLNSYPDHKLLMKQWQLAWNLDAVNFIPAYFLVGCLTIWNVRNIELFKEFFKHDFNRFCAIWFVVAFALANHEFAFKPIQPLHFTRGYIWMPLYLSGISTLLYIFKYLQNNVNNILRFIVIASIVILVLFDNLLWFGMQIYSLPTRKDNYLSAAMKDVFVFLDKKYNDYSEHYIMSQDPKLGYWVTVYTPFRSWMSHHFNTPDAAEKEQELLAFFENCSVQNEWKKSNVLIIYRKSFNNIKTDECLTKFDKASHKIFENSMYVIYSFEN